MPVKWKKSPRFKPEVVLERIALVRTVNPEGRVSFSGFELEDYLPALESMLDFPDVASEVDVATLVWRGIARIKGELTRSNFLDAINKELSDRLATREQTYFLLTSLSIDHRDIPQTISLSDAKMVFVDTNYPARFKSRKELFRDHALQIPLEPRTYCRVFIKVKAKTTNAAVNRALRALDIQRSLWCLMGNPRMQLAFGGAELKPINVVRLGSRHTLHLENGEPAHDSFWFESGFVEARIFRPNRPDIIKSNSRWAVRTIFSCKYGDRITSSLLRFVRALDEADTNTAFLRLWGALETLVTPGVADYDRLVQRCSFLFRDTNYHRQLLEHLREYRNVSVHAGEESEWTRTHCFQLQLYFVNLIWFHLRNARFFASLDEANAFLDLPPTKVDLERRLQLTRRACKFRT